MGENKNELDLTIIITNYNYGQHITQCVESALNQNTQIRKIIIVDDASTDDSMNKIKELEEKSSIIEIHLLNKNIGINGILNQFIPKIKTKYTTMLDADDWIHPDFFKDLAQTLEDNPQKSFAYSHCNLVNWDGKFIQKGISHTFSKELIMKKSFIPRLCIIETIALQSSLPLDTSISNGAKHHMWKKICRKNYEGILCPKELFFYRMHSKNISGIGSRILNDEPNKANEAILSGYWDQSSK